MVQPKYFVEVFHDYDSCPIQKSLLGQNTHDLILNQIIQRTFLRQPELNMSECIVNWRIISTPKSSSDESQLLRGTLSKGNVTAERAMKRLMKTYYNENKDNSREFKKSVVVLFIIGDRNYFRYIRKFQEASFKCLLLSSELAKPSYSHYFVGTLNLGSWEKLILQTPPLRSRSIGQARVLNYSSTLSLEHASLYTQEDGGDSNDVDDDDGDDDTEIDDDVKEKGGVTIDKDPASHPRLPINRNGTRFSISSLLAQSNVPAVTPQRVRMSVSDEGDRDRDRDAGRGAPSQLSSAEATSESADTNTKSVPSKTWSDSFKKKLLGIKNLRPMSPVRFFSPTRASNQDSVDTTSTSEIIPLSNTKASVDTTPNLSFDQVSATDAETAEIIPVLELRTDSDSRSASKIWLYSVIHVILFLSIAIMQYSPVPQTMSNLAHIPWRVARDIDISSNHAARRLWGKYAPWRSARLGSLDAALDFNADEEIVIWVRFHQLECESVKSLLTDSRCDNHYQKLAGFHRQLQLM